MKRISIRLHHQAALTLPPDTAKFPRLHLDWSSFVFLMSCFCLPSHTQALHRNGICCQVCPKHHVHLSSLSSLETAEKCWPMGSKPPSLQSQSLSPKHACIFKIYCQVMRQHSMPRLTDSPAVFAVLWSHVWWLTDFSLPAEDLALHLSLPFRLCLSCMGLTRQRL